MFSKETQVEFAKLMDEKKINILGLNDLTGAELENLGEILMLQDVKKKSSVNLRNEINQLTKLFLAGQVNNSSIMYNIYKKYSLKGTLPQVCTQARSNSWIYRWLLPTLLQNRVKNACASRDCLRSSRSGKLVKENANLPYLR